MNDRIKDVVWCCAMTFFVLPRSMDLQLLRERVFVLDLRTAFERWEVNYANINIIIIIKDNPSVFVKWWANNRSRGGGKWGEYLSGQINCISRTV